MLSRLAGAARRGPLLAPPFASPSSFAAPRLAARNLSSIAPGVRTRTHRRGRALLSSSPLSLSLGSLSSISLATSAGAPRAGGLLFGLAGLRAGPLRQVRWTRTSASRLSSSSSTSGTALLFSPTFTTGMRAGPTAGQKKAVGIWLAGTTAMVFGMVTLGGLTRLTRSGLSMVDWRPEGRKLPSTDEEWAVEFEKYKAFPEYNKVNSSMTVEEFKPIYFMEWFHRMWGRSLGVVFAVPFIGFAAKGWIPRNMYPRMALMFSMGGLQGLVGWWMVKSGLEHSHIAGFERSEYEVPRVSPYRLAGHLTMAFATYGVLAWTTMDFLNGGKGAEWSASVMKSAKPQVAKALGTMRNNARFNAALIAVTIISGAFVAGNDAGHAYNDFPFFAGQWIPEEIWDDRLSPSFRNAFENTALVQFDHRQLALATTGAVGLLLYRAYRPETWAVLPPRVRLACQCVGLGVAGQYVLGVTTLMNYVPVELGTAHQAGALTLWTLTLWVLHSMRPAAAAIKAAGVAGGPRMKVAAAAVAAVPVMAVGKGSAAGKVSM